MRQGGEDVGVIELGGPEIGRPDPLVHGGEIKHRNGRGAGENLGVLVNLQRLPLSSIRQQNVAVGVFKREGRGEGVRRGGGMLSPVRGFGERFHGKWREIGSRRASLGFLGREFCSGILGVFASSCSVRQQALVAAEGKKSSAESDKTKEKREERENKILLNLFEGIKIY